MEILLLGAVGLFVFTKARPAAPAPRPAAVSSALQGKIRTLMGTSASRTGSQVTWSDTADDAKQAAASSITCLSAGIDCDDALGHLKDTYNDLAAKIGTCEGGHVEVFDALTGKEPTSVLSPYTRYRCVIP